MWFSWVCVSTWVGGGDEERGGDGGDGGGEIVSWALRFTFSSLSRHMFASCCCFKASKSAFVFFYSCSICSRISHMIDVLARVERADELGSSFLVDTILWPRRIFLGPTVGAKCSRWVSTRFDRVVWSSSSQWDLRPPMLKWREVLTKGLWRAC